MSLTPGPGARQALQLTQQFLSHSVVERPSPLEPPAHAKNTPMCLAGKYNLLISTLHTTTINTYEKKNNTKRMKKC